MGGLLATVILIEACYAQADLYTTVVTEDCMHTLDAQSCMELQLM